MEVFSGFRIGQKSAITEPGEALHVYISREIHEFFAHQNIIISFSCLCYENDRSEYYKEKTDYDHWLIQLNCPGKSNKALVNVWPMFT